MKHIISSCFLLLSLNIVAQNISVTINKTVTLKELFKQIRDISPNYRMIDHCLY